jgi:uncharacterized UBP type Zn finger protein
MTTPEEIVERLGKLETYLAAEDEDEAAPLVNQAASLILTLQQKVMDARREAFEEAASEIESMDAVGFNRSDAAAAIRNLANDSARSALDTRKGEG